MKKIVMCLVAFSMLFAFTACGNNDEEAQVLPGGYQVVENNTAELPEDVQAAFDTATETYAENLKPVVYVASQVVAGTNYMILCELDGAYKMVVIYEDLQGNATITNETDFDTNYYLVEENEAITAGEGVMSGGWTVAEKSRDVQHEDVFYKSEVNAEPLVLLATQEVPGINYAFLCKKDNLAQVYVINENSDGVAKDISVCTLDLTEFTQ